MLPHQLNPQVLIGRYIPNVTAVPFTLERPYIETIYQQTQSPVLHDVLSTFEEFSSKQQLLAYLVLVELLAYQFASPVRWIETQKVFFAQLAVERLIEVGPAPTLSQMAKQTLAMGNYSPLTKHENLWYNRDRDQIYYNHEDPEPSPVVPEQAPEPVKPGTLDLQPAAFKKSKGHMY